MFMFRHTASQCASPQGLETWFFKKKNTTILRILLLNSIDSTWTKTGQSTHFDLRKDQDWNDFFCAAQQVQESSTPCPQPLIPAHPNTLSVHAVFPLHFGGQRWVFPGQHPYPSTLPEGVSALGKETPGPKSAPTGSSVGEQATERVRNERTRSHHVLMVYVVQGLVATEVLQMFDCHSKIARCNWRLIVGNVQSGITETNE